MGDDSAKLRPLTAVPAVVRDVVGHVDVSVTIFLGIFPSYYSVVYEFFVQSKLIYLLSRSPSPRSLSRSFSVSLFVALLYRWDAGAWSDNNLAGSSCVPSSDPSTVVNEYCSPNDEFHVSAQRLVWVEESSSEGGHPDTIVSYLAGEYDTDPKWQNTLSKGRYVRVSVSNAGAKVVSNVPVVTPTPMLESGSNGRVSNIEYVLPMTKDSLLLVILRDRTTWYQVSFFFWDTPLFILLFSLVAVSFLLF